MNPNLKLLQEWLTRDFPQVLVQYEYNPQGLNEYLNVYPEHDSRGMLIGAYEAELWVHILPDVAEHDVYVDFPSAEACYERVSRELKEGHFGQ